MSDYSDFYNLMGDNFNIEAVCPDYLPESQCVFTWHRDERGVAVVSGYDPEQDPTTDWLCHCGHYETGGCCCTNCGNEPPWGCVGCGMHNDDYNEDMDFGDFDPYEGTYELPLDYDGYYEEL